MIVVLLLLTGPCAFAQEDSTALSADSPSESFTVVAANPKLKGNGFTYFLMGRNYRKEWTTPVKVPLLNLKAAYGGLEPKKEGGGKETRSLRVEDKSGHEWALRSVKKYPQNAIPDELKHTVAEKIASDGISASYPYGVLSMEVLANAAHVPFLEQSLVYLPDDPALGEFRSKYKNSLVLMEDREPHGIYSWEGKAVKAEKAISTEELVYQLYQNNNRKVDQLAVLRARLLDNFVMDFDRHEGQWDWVSSDSGSMKIFYPVPKDRDQVFFTNQGLIPKIMRGKERFPELQGFRAKVDHMNTFNKAARNFDRTFLTGLSAEDWSREVDRFLQAMTDSVIESALAKQPAEIRNDAAKKIIKTLKKKRKYFREDMMRYYRRLSGTVSVVGSNEREQFNLYRKNDGTVLVTIHKLDSSGKQGTEIYRRAFDRKETNEIRLYGLEGDDRFETEGRKSGIKIRMIGGPGNDDFINKDRRKKLSVYDVSFEDNRVEGMASHIRPDPLNNMYTRLGYNYKNISLGPSVEISSTQGLYLGARFRMITQGFHKDPYSQRHFLSVTHSVNFASFHFRYEADLMKLTRVTDLLVRGDLMLPTSRTNFFGLGNETKIEKIKGDIDRYHAHYDIGNLALLGRTSFSPWFRILYGPSFQYLNLRREENASQFVAEFYSNNISARDVYARKLYGGGEFQFQLNTKDHAMLPRRGVVFTGNASILAGLNEKTHSLTQAAGSFTFYTDLHSEGCLVLALRMGAARNFGKFEFEQAQYLGQTEKLRGYRVQRFAGRASAFNNAELRIRIADVNTWLFPASIGIYGFHDIGRVWADGESSDTWHRGYGGGLWLAPFQRVVLAGYLSFSKEEKALPWVSIGFQL